MSRTSSSVLNCLNVVVGGMPSSSAGASGQSIARPDMEFFW